MERYNYKDIVDHKKRKRERVNFVEDTSYEVIAHICSFLDASSLCNASLVCRALYHISTHSYHWRTLCTHDINFLTLQEKKPENRGWKYWYLELRRIANNWSHKKYLLQSLQGYGAIWGLVLSNPNFLHVGAFDNTIRTWDLRTGECVHVLRRIPAFSNVPINYTSIFVGNDENIMVISDSHDCFRIFELYTSRLLYEIPFDGTITVMQLGSRNVVYATTQNVIHVVDIETKDSIAVLEGHTRSIRCLQYDEERGLLATGSLDQTIRVWDLNSNKCKVLTGHTMSIKCLQFNAKLDMLLSGSGDGTLRGWKLSTGELQHVAVERVLALGFNGQYIVTAGTAKIVVRDFNTWNSLYFIWTTYPVTCLLVQDTRIIAGSKNISVYSFDADQKSILACMKREEQAAQITPPRRWHFHFALYLLFISLWVVFLAFFVQMYL